LAEARIPRKGKRGSSVEVQEVFLDASGRAYIPGSSLKGFLRNYLESRGVAHGLWRSMFGYQEATSLDDPRGKGLGGAITVRDARLRDGELPLNIQDPYWDPRRATSVASHVVIERRTRTAKEELLFFEEYVPAGISFAVTLLVEGGDRNGQEAEEMAAELLAALKGLRGSSARLGASNAEGWGWLEWKLGLVRRLTEASMRTWLAKPGSLLLNHLEAVDSAPLIGRPEARTEKPRWLTFDVDLNVRGPFLVNDPSKVKQKGEDSGRPNHSPLRTAEDAPVLPGSSLHGALRSQAERIVRTLGGGVAETTVKGREDLGRLDAVSCLFGAAGWRSPVRVSEFTLAPGSPKPERKTQEFVAIDRFTGGGADALKFNAEGFVAGGPEGFTLRGSIALDTTALERLMKDRKPPLTTGGSKPDWKDLAYLFAYTIRDLCEGDVPLGFGRSKGYGACSGTVTAAHAASFGPDVQWFATLLNQGGENR
jgi:CRISPR/Cas system CSM-associated protein Csm3 (group 7 of RAMP superfamily)